MEAVKSEVETNFLNTGRIKGLMSFPITPAGGATPGALHVAASYCPSMSRCHGFGGGKGPGGPVVIWPWVFETDGLPGPGDVVSA